MQPSLVAKLITLKCMTIMREVYIIKTFATHIIITQQDAALIKKLGRNDDFYFDFRDDPSYSNWETENGGSMSVHTVLSQADIIRYQSNNYILAKELLIIAKDSDIAENILNLIYGGMVLVYPSLLENPEPPFCYEINKGLTPIEFYLKQSMNEQALFGCLVALYSWKQEELVYCVEKFRFSISLDYFTPHSSHPRYGMMFSNSPTNYRRHVTAGYALFTAYSIIEELGLEIRSSAKKPRFLKDGQWNPIVKEDILCRLNKIGIKEEDSIFWLQRGEPTPFQREIQPSLGIESEYNTYKDVRDLKLKIHEALHYASYIRNYFIAHKFSDITKYISPYDVNNVQTLTRFLLLNKFGFWKKSIDEIRKESNDSSG